MVFLPLQNELRKRAVLEAAEGLALNSPYSEGPCGLPPGNRSPALGHSPLWLDVIVPLDKLESTHKHWSITPSQHGCSCRASLCHGQGKVPRKTKEI